MNDFNGRDIQLFLKDNGLLHVIVGEREIEVHVKQCFPWSEPTEWLSLRDPDDNEVCLIEKLDDLDSETQAILKRYMNVVDFVLDVTEILSIEEDVELRQFHVLTKQGERIFQTKLEDWPEILEDGSILIEDLSGDLFKVRSFTELNEKSKKVLSTYVA